MSGSAPAGRAQPAPWRRAGLAFVAVGAAAAALHYLLTLLLAGPFGLAPAVANTAGFLAAFPLSYLGHRHLSFADRPAPHRQALPRLLLVSLTAFASNQLLLDALLRLTPLPLWLALGLVLVGVALGTFLAGRCWAFAA